MDANEKPTRLYRLRDIIGPCGLIPVSRSTFYRGIEDGRFPRPLKIGRISVWRASDIDFFWRGERGDD